MASPSEFSPGHVFAEDFMIIERLSEGGMGSVYVAEQRSTKKRRALKLMLPGLVKDAKLRERFVREAQVAARIESDHIVEVVAAGVDGPTGIPWLAMELVSGEELGEVLERRGPLAQEEVREIVRQLCHGLGAAHEAGIVHRDLKPQNIFLANARRADVAFTVKVLDFGIAKIAEEAKTQGTDTLGTPFWMAPEQAERGVNVSPSADVWALGLIVFTMLTGKCFWLSATDAEPSTLKILKEMCLDPLPAASDRARALGVGHLLPTRLDAWFERTITRATADRYPDATEAFAALGPLLAEHATGGDAPVVPTPTQPRKSKKKTRPDATVFEPATEAAQTQPKTVLAVPLAEALPSPKPSRLTLGVVMVLGVGAVGAAVAVAMRSNDAPQPGPASASGVTPIRVTSASSLRSSSAPSPSVATIPSPSPSVPSPVLTPIEHAKARLKGTEEYRTPYSRAKARLATVLDIDGDGFGDLGLLCAPREGVKKSSYYLFRGGTEGLGAKPSVEVATSGPHEGYGFVDLGDLNGDGRSDFSIKEEIFLGDAAHPTSIGTVRDLVRPDAIVDLDGDGRSDLVDRSGSYVLTKSDTSPPVQLELGVDTAKLGGAAIASAAGDFNGDGVGDLLIGVTEKTSSNDGRAMIFLGTPEGPATAPSFTIPPPSDLAPPLRHLFGTFVESLGDVDGDGRGDFAIGTLSDPWRYTLYYGADRGSEPRIGPTLAAFEIGAGDFNGDGIADIVVNRSAQAGLDEYLGSKAGIARKPTKSVPSPISCDPSQSTQFLSGPVGGTP